MDGNPSNGAFDMAFSIYGQPSGGSPLFTDTRAGANQVPVVNGVFTVAVGTGPLSGQPLAQALSGADRWLQVTIAGTALPRQKLAAMPYALAVASASIGAVELADGAVGSGQIADGAVRSGHIASGAVTDAKVSDIAWSKVANVPVSVGGPAVLDGGTVVLPAASTINFTAGPFAVAAGPAGRANVSLSASSVTLRGNAFNLPNRLVLLDSTGAVPTPHLAGAYPGITGVGTLTAGLWQASPVPVFAGGTGASSAGQARLNLGMAASTASLTGFLGLTGGGSLAADRTISVSTAGLPAGGCSAAGDKLTWNASTVRLECGVDQDANTVATGGDLSGNQDATTVVRLQGFPIASSAPAIGHTLKWNGAAWWPETEALSPFSWAGTQGRAAYWTAAAALGSSVVSENASTATVSGALSVSGSISGPNVTSGADPGHTHSIYASTTHVHSAGDGSSSSIFTSGVLPVARGGTGKSTWVPDRFVRAQDASTLQERTDAEVFADIGAAAKDHSHPGTSPHGGTNRMFPRFNGASAVQDSVMGQFGDQVFIESNYAPGFTVHPQSQTPSVPAVWIENTANTGTTVRSLDGFYRFNYTAPVRNVETSVRVDVSGGSGVNIGMEIELSSATPPADSNHGIQAYAGQGTPLTARGLQGEATGSTLNYGVYGRAVTLPGAIGRALYGGADGGTVNYGLYAAASGGAVNWAGYFNGDVQVNGALSKTSGTFDIPHPDPARRADGWRLRHSFVESPTRGDNVYRFAVEVKGGKAEVALPAYFRHLNEDAQVVVSARRHLGQGWGRVDAGGGRVLLEADQDGAYNVLVIATRKDADARVFDEKGVEYREGRP